MEKTNSMTHYRLVAQNMKDELIFEIIGQSHLLVRTAQEVLSDTNLLYGLPPNQVALVGYIAGMNVSAESKI